MFVDKAIFDGLEFVRGSGVTNMFDSGRVADILKQFKYIKAYEWIISHKEDYCRGLFEGFEPVDDMFSEDEEVREDIDISVEISIEVGGKKKYMSMSGEVADLEIVITDLKRKYGNSNVNYTVTGKNN